MAHRNARLTLHGRLLIVDRHRQGLSVAGIAEGMGISRQTAYKWIHRFLAEGAAGLEDRSSRPRRCPAQVHPRIEARVLAARARLRVGPHELAGVTGVSRSTIYKILVRNNTPTLAVLDKPTGEVIRRYQRDVPGELVHVDVKKLAKIPAGGGWRTHGRGNAGPRKRVGYTYLHSAVDDCSRVAFTLAMPGEKAIHVEAFLIAMLEFYASHGVIVTGVMTDRAKSYRSNLIHALFTASGITHIRTRAYRPQTNGKVERFHRTLIERWAYARAYRSEGERLRALQRFLEFYNHRRPHTALGGRSPHDLVNNLCGNYT